MHPACSNKKKNHLQNSLLRRAQFWVRKTFSKLASLKRASPVFRPCVSKVCADPNDHGLLMSEGRAQGSMDGHLLAVRFADNRAPGTKWDIDPEFTQWNCFSTTVEGASLYWTLSIRYSSLRISGTSLRRASRSKLQIHFPHVAVPLVSPCAC